MTGTTSGVDHFLFAAQATARKKRRAEGTGEFAPPPVSHPQHGEPSVEFEYHDAAGNLIGLVCRWDRDGTKEIRPATLDDGGWRWAAFAKPRPLYRLPDITAHHEKTVLVVEGEGVVDAARETLDSFVATCWPGGTGGVAHVDWSPLNGRDVVLWPDADPPGAKAMRAVAGCLDAVGARSVRIVKLPDGLPTGWD